MSYSYYGNISTLEKDKLADGSELKRLNDEYRRKNQEHYSSPDNIVLTPKRRHDDMDNDVQEIENDNFQLGHQGRNITEKKNNAGRGMVIFNSHSQNGRKTNESIKREQIKEINVQYHVKNKILQHALHYAVAHQLPTLKINCQSEVKDHLEGTNLIKEIFSYIHEDFRKANKSYNRPIGFDIWYVDKQGAFICFTKEIELFVYLWDSSHYPDKLLNTTITSISPAQLLSQHSIIFKFVPKKNII